jgi:hypothetical protein
VKQLAVVIATAELPRVREALRAAVGLGLRGDQVTVVATAALPPDPQVDRAVATLRQLGRTVAGAGALAEILAGSDHAEVWT